MVESSEMSWRLEDGSRTDAQTSIAAVRHGEEEVDLMTDDGLTCEHLGVLTVRLVGLWNGDENGTDECLKRAGVYRHEKCSWYWLLKRMMAMTRDRVAVGHREDDIGQQLHEDSPVTTVVKAAGDNVLFIVISESKAVVVNDSAAGGCSRSGESEACGCRWPVYDDGRPGNGAIDERRVTSR